jgi:hypothetical protein
MLGQIMTLRYAKELQNEFPHETRGFSLSEIDNIWSEYSDLYAAGWITPRCKEVEDVFNRMR